MICLDAMSLARVRSDVCASTSQLRTRGTTVTSHVLHWNNKQHYPGQTLLGGCFICFNLINSLFKMWGVRLDSLFFFLNSCPSLLYCSIVKIPPKRTFSIDFYSEYSKKHVISSTLNGPVVLLRHNAAHYYLCDSSF